MQAQTNQHKQLLKDYKRWVIKATEAAQTAKKQNVPLDECLAYVAADNIAKTIFAKLN